MKYKFAERLRECRIENEISQANPALICNVSQSKISNLERGTTLPDAEMIVTICKVLHESADYLLGIKDY